MKNSKLHMLKETSSFQMMSIILESDQGHLIVIDGGWEYDSLNLIEYLTSLSKGTPVVDAWFLTHAHSDHINAFMNIVENYSDSLVIKKVLYNFPDVSKTELYEPDEAHTTHEFNELYPKFQSKAEILQKGDVFNFGNLEIKVLQTLCETETANFINNSSVVLRVKSPENTVLLLSDLGVEGGRRLLENVPESELKSNIVQMAHHGQHGVEENVYQIISPKICLWATPLWLWDNDIGEGFNTHVFQTVIVRKWMENLGVKTHFISKDGNHILPL